MEHPYSMQCNSGSKAPVWPLIALLGTAITFGALYSSTAAHHTSTWTSVPTMSTTVNPMTVTVQNKGAFASLNTRMTASLPDDVEVAHRTKQLSTGPGSEILTGPLSIIGALGVMATLAAGWFMKGNQRRPLSTMEPLRTVAVAAEVRPKFMDPGFQDMTLRAFPGKAVATVEEARVLWEQGGYTFLDVRSDLEGSEGRIRGPSKGSVDIPMFEATAKYDADIGKKVMKQEVNAKWLEQVKARFPPDAKIIIYCSDGGKRTSEALDLLAAEGYTNVVAMKGGYNAWDQMFDKKLGLRTPQQMEAKAEWLVDKFNWNTWSAKAGVTAPPRSAQATSLESAAQEVEAPTSVETSSSSGSPRPLVNVPKFKDPAFQEATLAAFPAKGYATPEEARVLWKQGGYTLLDIRSDLEGIEGRIRGPSKGSVDIPMFQATSKYDASIGKKVVKPEVNPTWLEQVKARFAPDAKIIILCSDGDKRTSEALDLLAAEGYKNIVAMRGGYNAWDQIFDKRLGVRTPQQMQAKTEWLVDKLNWPKWADKVGVATPPQSAQAALAQPAAPPVFDISESSEAKYLDPAFQQATLAAFPAKGYASVEEARVLWKQGGYTLLDIRSDLEGTEGRIRGPSKGSVDIPMFQANATYDAAIGKKVMKQEANAKWLDQVKERFDKAAKIIVMCSDGDKRTTQALDLLAAEGYTNVVAMRGGYNAWDQMFDNKLAMRTPQEMEVMAEWLVDRLPWGKWASKVGVAVPPQSPQAALAQPSPAPVVSRPVGSGPKFLDPTFQQSTIAQFPARGYADIEEARVLWKQGGYTILDVRSEMEGVEGRIRGPNKGSVDFPMFFAKAIYDSNLGKKVVEQQPNPQWLEQVKDRFAKGAKIIVMCSDGQNRTTQALQLLKAEGYQNVVAMKGGYNAWDQMFDKRLGLRTPQQMQAKAAWLVDPIEWGQWTGETNATVAPAAPAPAPVAADPAPADPAPAAPAAPAPAAAAIAAVEAVIATPPPPPVAEPAASAAVDTSSPAVETAATSTSTEDEGVSRRETLSPLVNFLLGASAAVIAGGVALNSRKQPGAPSVDTAVPSASVVPPPPPPAVELPQPKPQVSEAAKVAEVPQVVQEPQAPPVFKSDEDGIADPKAWIETNLPEALPVKDFIRVTSKILSKQGMNPENTLTCVGVCRDELCQPFIDDIEQEWGEPFSMTSLGGMLRLGKTGLQAALAHSPLDDKGRERYFFLVFPHLAVDSAGLGKCFRPGRSKPSKACGALYAFTSELKQGDVKTDDPLDPEYNYMKSQLLDLIPKDETPDFLEVTKLAAKASLQQVEALAAATVDPSRCDYAVCVGVLVHQQDMRPEGMKIVGGGRQYVDQVWPLAFYQVKNGKKKDLIDRLDI